MYYNQRMTDYSEATDEELVLLSVENTVAFGVLVSRYEDRLKRYLWHLGVAQKQDSEDVLQDAFLKIYRNLRKFDPSLKFSSWAYRIVHNEAINFVRANKRRPQGNYVYDGEEALLTLAHKEELDEQIAVKFEADAMVEAMEKLKPKYKDILVLRYMEGLEYKEISDVLKLPMGSVATHLYRAKKALAGLMPELESNTN